MTDSFKMWIWECNFLSCLQPAGNVVFINIKSSIYCKILQQCCKKYTTNNHGGSGGPYEMDTCGGNI